MYGNTGVCEVMDYATPDLPGMPRGTKYYVLRPLFQSGTIYCPVEQPKVFMRPVMNREEAEELVALIPTISVEPFRTGRLPQHIGHPQHRRSRRDHQIGVPQKEGGRRCGPPCQPAG